MRWLIPLCVAVCIGSPTQAQFAEEETVQSANNVLREIMEIPAKGIPAALLADARGVAIIPGMIKGGFVVGVRHGKGVLITRDNTGAWRAPVFITVTGGSVGWQAGLQATDLVLVFKTQASVDGLIRGKFTIGADASVAAGPVGRQASAATDGQLKAEILSWSRSRGLFAGVAIDGAILHVDQRATAAYHGVQPGPPQMSPAALKLLEQVALYAGGKQPAPLVGPVPPVGEPPLLAPPVVQPDEREAVRQQLAKTAQQLQTVLDPQWQKYLALPAEWHAGPTPTPDKLAPFLNRYDVVASDPRYRTLAERREFQETRALLRRLIAVQVAPPADVLKLPPPPGP